MALTKKRTKKTNSSTTQRFKSARMYDDSIFLTNDDLAIVYGIKNLKDVTVEQVSGKQEIKITASVRNFDLFDWREYISQKDIDVDMETYIDPPKKTGILKRPYRSGICEKKKATRCSVTIPVPRKITTQGKNLKIIYF